MGEEPKETKDKQGTQERKKRSPSEIARALAKRWFIDAMGAMAQGLFASLLIGTILNTLGTQLGWQWLADAGKFAQSMAGPAMAIAIGFSLKASPFVIFSLAAVGAAANSLGGAGGPLAVYVIAIIAAELGQLVSKKTKIDLIVTPAVTILSGVVLAQFIAEKIGAAAMACGGIIMWATERQPFVMGIIVSVVVGILLTLPISSAAICSALGLVGLAGGAAVAGCSAQMIGFAVISSARTNGADLRRRASAPRCSRCRTFSAIRAFGSRPPLHPPSPVRSRPASSICRTTARRSPAVWVPAGSSVRSAFTPAG